MENKPKLSFEDFLIDRHAEQYVGVDDDMPDSYDDWIADLDIDDYLRYGQIYGNIVYREGFCAGINHANNIIKEA